MKVIVTPRLILREVTQDDFTALAEMLHDPLVEEYNPPHVQQPITVQNWIDRPKASYARHGHGLWAVELKSSPGLIGMIGILNHEIPEVSELEIGWHLKRTYWNMGYAKEAAIACREYGVTTLRQNKMIALIRPDNELSIRVAKSIGMAFEKVIFIKKFNRETTVYSITMNAT